jgi:hypothetical protein
MLRWVTPAAYLGICVTLLAWRAWAAGPTATTRPAGGRTTAPATAPTSKPALPPFTPTVGYEKRSVEGWTVRVHKDLLAGEHRELCSDAVRELEVQLYHIRRAVPAKAVGRLQEVVFWLEYRNPRQDTACYHPSRGWLEAHGYNPEKAKAVEIGNAAVFLDYARHQPWMVLHELAHAYHDQVLGWEHPKVKAAFEQAAKGGTYEKVLIWDGRIARHYAMTNVMEYFAEDSEAYFGTNDIYPFVRAELKQHDPAMYGVLRELWGVPGAKGTGN